MTKVLVLYYSAYGHMEKMAYAAAEGARSGGAEATVKRVPELVPEDLARKSGMKLDQPAPVAAIQDLAGYDAIIVGFPTRFGRMASQMSNFLDQAGGLWFNNALVGKVGSVMTSTAAQHGGQETTLMSGITNLLHFGMVVVGLPYTYAPQMTMDEVSGNTPYGASTITGGQGQRHPSGKELDAARYQGKHVAAIAAKLAKK